MPRLLALLVFGAALTVAAAADRGIEASSDAPEADRTPPVIDVPPVLATPVTAPLTLKIRVEDDSAVRRVRLLARGEHDTAFRSVELEGTAPVLTARIAPDDARGTRVSFYVEATDAAGNGPVTAGSASDPLSVELVTLPDAPPNALATAFGILLAGVVALVGWRTASGTRPWPRYDIAASTRCPTCFTVCARRTWNIRRAAAFASSGPR